MLNTAIYIMIYLGSALMVYNIYGFFHFANEMKKNNTLRSGSFMLYIPILLLTVFLIGYLAVGIFGKPDFIVSGILFGGSIFVFIMYIYLDRITKKIMDGEKLNSQLAAERETNRVKNAFLSSISHEMRTPVNVIMGLDSIALKNPDLDPKTKDALVKIGKSSTHLLGLINNILDMNQIENGELKAREEAFRLHHVLDQINAIADSLCREKGLEYRFESIPETDRLFCGDEMLIKQVLLELLDNAVKYTDSPGTVTFRVTGEEESDDRMNVIFSVRDTGVGMSEEFMKSLFSLFSQEDGSSTDRHGGSGLGLAAASRRVGLLGGKISAESEKNKGSVFTVVLPLKYMAEATDEEKSEEEEISLVGKRVLIVEDIAENAEIVADLLELEDICSEHAENGEIAVRMFEESDINYYDAILMDLRMPVMDGLSAARAIRNSDRTDAKTVPIIALTANAFESDIRDSLAAGMNCHLAKPADADLLYSTLRTAISSGIQYGGKGGTI